MPEVGIPYIFVGPDGTRAVLNDPTDPDFVGYLNADNGMTGLLDGAIVRENTQDRVEADGAVPGLAYRGRRVGTIQGILRADGDITVVTSAEQKLKRATRGIRADVDMRWTPTGQTIQRRLLLRRTSTPAFPGRWPKTFQIALASADHRVQSAVEHLQTITPGGATGELGVVSPITDPFHTTFGSAGATTVLNAGDEDASWRAVLTGPLTNPIIVNNTSGEQLAFTWTLAAGEQLIVVNDTTAHTVKLGTGQDRYRAVNFAASTWWFLHPGPSDVRLLAQSSAVGAQLDFYWRDAYE